MKPQNKFITIFIIISAIMCISCTIFSVISFNNLRDNANENTLEIISYVKQKYPNISSHDISNILNGSKNTEQAKKELSQYGIDFENEWLTDTNNSAEFSLSVISAIISATFCLIFIMVFIFYCISRKKRTKEITSYLIKLNERCYDLKIDDNSEDELSLLKNEIYKTQVMLKEQAETKIKEKEELKNSLSDISHQLKTPLTSIIVMLDNIIDDENMPDEIRRDFINDIKRETNSISFLVQSILTLSKLDANSINFKRKTVNVLSLLETCVKNTEILAEIKSTKVSVECSNDILINCDSYWLSQAITNIVKNCIEHTPNGTVLIKASQNKLYSKITIKDNGCGIYSDDLPHIFERFYKGRNSDNDSVGIGLALAKTIIEKSNGYIFADSAEGKGTEFTIKFFDNYTV